jgi:predicted nuclease with RNAse H fold
VSPRVPVAVGLDLAGSPLRTTGFCRLTRSGVAELHALHSDEEILEATRAARPQIVSIDAPLSLPRGRQTIEDRSGPHLRACDRELLARHIRFFPITLGPMRMLTTRGLGLQERLRAEGFQVIESYPGGAQDVLRIPRKGAGLPALRRGLRTLGLTGDIERRDVTHDELDAATCALVGLEVLAGRAEALGDPSEGLLYLPRVRPVSASGRRRAARR